MRHSEDALPVAAVVAGVALALVPLSMPFSPGALVLFALASYALRIYAPLHQHCHAHVAVFRAPVLNELYDVVLGVASGQTTAAWELQHCLGHHRTHLHPERDVAGQHRFTAPGPFQRVIFTVLADLCATIDAFRIARDEAVRRPDRDPRPRLRRQLAVQLAIHGALLYVAPLEALICVIAPSVLLRWSVFFFSYRQHADVPRRNVYSGSVTRLGAVNRWLLNVGHHTAHHEKPTLHWTMLPERTARIRHLIPAECLR
jgi:fatty acid desaturase